MAFPVTSTLRLAILRHICLAGQVTTRGRPLALRLSSKAGPVARPSIRGRFHIRSNIRVCRSIDGVTGYIHGSRQTSATLTGFDGEAVRGAVEEG